MPSGPPSPAVQWVPPAGGPQGTAPPAQRAPPLPSVRGPALGMPVTSFISPAQWLLPYQLSGLNQGCWGHSALSITWLPSRVAGPIAQSVTGFAPDGFCVPPGPALRRPQLLAHDSPPTQGSQPGTWSSGAQVPAQIPGLRSAVPPCGPQPRVRLISFMFREVGFEMNEMGSGRWGSCPSAQEPQPHSFTWFPFCLTGQTTFIWEYRLLITMHEVLFSAKHYWLKCFLFVVFIPWQFADSFNFNPHKWLLVNFDCSAMW